MSFCRQSSRSIPLRPALNHLSSIRKTPAHHVLRQYANVSSTGEVAKAPVIPVLRKRSEILAEEKAKRRASEIAQLKEEFQPYSEEEWKALAQYYTPEQLEALKDAEKVIDTDDLATQWGPRTDKWIVDYTDDLAQIDPLVDHKVKPEITHAPSYRLMSTMKNPEELATAVPMTFFDMSAEVTGIQERESHQQKMAKVYEALERLKTELPERILAGKLHFNSRLKDWEPERKIALDMFNLFKSNPQEFFSTLRERNKLDGPEQREMIKWWKRMASHTFQSFEIPENQVELEKWTLLPTGNQIMEVERVVDEVFEKDEEALQEAAKQSLDALKQNPTAFLDQCKEALNLEAREKYQKIRLWTEMIEEWKAALGLPAYQDIRLASESTKQDLPSQKDMASLDMVIEELLKSMKSAENEQPTDPNAISLISNRPFKSKDEEVAALLKGITELETELKGYNEAGVEILSQRYDMEAELYYYKPDPNAEMANERMNEYWDILAQNFDFQAMSLTEMLYRIERTTLRPEVKAELRALYIFKDTFKEYIAKAILWEFVPKRQEMPRIAPEGKLSIQELLDEIDQLDMDEIKKHELLSYSHWVNTPKEEALRPMLEKALAQFGAIPTTEQAPRRLRMLLNLIKDKMKVGLTREDAMFRNEVLENAVRKTFQKVPNSMVIGEAKNIYQRPIYSEINAEIPKIKDPRVRYTPGAEDGKLLALQRLSKQTGYSIDELKKFRVREVVSNFVTNQTRKGKIMSMYVLSVAGNQNGMVGIGEGKSTEVGDAILQSHINALRNMKPVYRYEDRTIYGEISKRVGGTTVQLSARPPGFGVRTQSLIFEIARCAGIRDLAARVGRSRNKMNTVKAAMEALTSQKLPEDIAKARGMKLVDLRKVYYGRTVY